jgi:hypothetical protein
MADNTTINTGSGGDVIASDDIGGSSNTSVSRLNTAQMAARPMYLQPRRCPSIVRDSTGTQIHRAYGPLRVSHEETTLFLDTHDTALDTTTRWNTATGTNAPSVSASALSFGVATTASIYGKLTSQPTFSPLIPGFLQNSWAINLGTAASTERTGGHRFWGIGSSPATPATTSAATKLTDAIGFEVDTDGKMYAVVYANGSRTATDLSASGTGNAASKQPLDGAYHRYICQIRTDRIYWFIDSLDTYVATASFVTPTTQTLPLLLQTINPAAGVATGGYPLSVQGSVVADTAGNSTQISDGTYQWRKAALRQVTSGGTGLAIAGASQPNTTGTITASGQSVTTGNIDMANVVSVWTYGTHAGINLTFEASYDNTNWTQIPCVRMDTMESAYATGVITSNAIRQYTVGFPGANYFRARSTAYTSGTMNIAIDPGTLPMQPSVSSILQVPKNPQIDATGTARGITTFTFNQATQATAAAIASAPGAGLSIRVLSYAVVATAAVTFTFNGPSTAVRFDLAANGGMSFAGSLQGPAFDCAANTAFTWSTGAAVQVGGHVTYTTV